MTTPLHLKKLCLRVKNNVEPKHLKYILILCFFLYLDFINSHIFELSRILAKLIGFTLSILSGNVSCTAKIRFPPLAIDFTGIYNVSHCSYCQCYASNKYDCHVADIKGRTRQLCQDCDYMRPHVTCSYCLDPENGVTKIAGGRRVPLFDYMCISCQCSQEGTIYCNYNNTQQCRDQQSCRNYFKQLKNGTIPYQCKDCVFDGRRRKVYSIWKIMINGNEDQIKCRCQIDGKVNCEIESRIEEFRFLIRHTNCSSTKIIEEKFKHNGKLNYLKFLLL